MGHSATLRDFAPSRPFGRVGQPRPSPAARFYELQHGQDDDCRKVVILLEELGEPYRIVAAPGAAVLIDNDPAEGGAACSVADPGAMLFYLAEKSGRFLPQQAWGRTQVTQWVMWLKLSEGGHFRQGANEASRLFGVLNTRLAEGDFIAGDAYTIADIAAFVWVLALLGDRQVAEEFPHLARWFVRVGARPAIGRALRRH